MIGPVAFSIIAARHGLQLKNCDTELAKFKYTDAVLVLDTAPAAWIEFFVRANILQPDSNWKDFANDYSNYFNVIAYGNNRIPLWILPLLTKQNGLIVNTINDFCYYNHKDN